MEKTLRDLQFEELFSDAWEELDLKRLADEVARDVLEDFLEAREEDNRQK